MKPLSNIMIFYGRREDNDHYFISVMFLRTFSGGNSGLYEDFRCENIAGCCCGICRGHPRHSGTCTDFPCVFGLPFLGIQFPNFEIWGVDFERLSAGVLALILNSGAYQCEIVRSGIQSIHKGQLEAAMSLGFSKWESMVRIIIPQAIRNILPVIGNEFVTLIKESSQVSVIGMADLMYTAATIQGISFQPFPPLVIVAVYYFVMTFFVSSCLRVLEIRLKVRSVR